MGARIIVTVSATDAGGAWRPRPTVLAILPVCALALGVLGRVSVGRTMPLWFDETFTAVIATQASPAALLRWCLTELTGPAFYAPMWLWVQMFGASAPALRLPALACSVAAPLLLMARGHSDRTTRLLWASLVLLWLPAFADAQDARPYAQIFLLACCQTIAFAHLLRAPATGRAFAWTGITALLLLTHYSAVVISACEGIAYLALHRRRAIATWPALAPALPVVGWAWYHLPFVLALTGAMGGGSGSGGIASADLLAIPSMLFGVGTVGVLMLGFVAASVVLSRMRGRATEGGDRVDAIVGWTGAAAVAAMLVLATLRAGFAPRYLMSAMPAFLFGMAVWARWCLRFDVRPVAGAVLAMGAGLAGLLLGAATREGPDAQHLFSLDAASAWLIEERPTRLVFLWTDPIGDRSGDRNIAEVAGYAFRGAGRPVAVRVIHRRPGHDTSVLARAAAAHEGTAILWIANDRTLADRTAVRVAQQDPRWTCRDFGGDQVLVTACRR